MDPGSLPPALTNRPFTVATARSAGLTWKTLQGQTFTSPCRGLYALADREVSESALVSGVLATLPPGTVATGVTGLRLAGVTVGQASPLHFVTTYPRQVRRRGIRVTRVTVLPPCHGDAAVPEHCWMVAALDLNMLDLVTAGDWLIRLNVTSPESLTSYVNSSTSRGRAAARPALALIRERVDSPRESWLRLCVVMAGLPEPTCNPTIQGIRLSGRVDLLYSGFRVIIEYEGDQHRADRRQWNRDIDRFEDFTGAGFVIIRVTAEQARYPRLVVRRVHAAIQARGYGGPDPRFDQRWMGLFER